MTIETYISAIALLSIVVIFVIIPKWSYALARKEAYEVATLRRARIKWERSVLRAVAQCERVLCEPEKDSKEVAR